MLKDASSHEILEKIEKMSRETDAFEEELSRERERHTAVKWNKRSTLHHIKEFILIWLVVNGAIHFVLDIVGVVYRWSVGDGS